MEIDTNPSEYNEIELRPMNCKLDAHTRSDGSAMLAQGKLILAPMNCILFVR